MYDHPVGTHSPGSHRCSVEHQVGGVVEQEPVLATTGLSLGAIGHDYWLRPTGSGHGTPLDPYRKPGSAVAAQSALVDYIEERGGTEVGQCPPTRQVGIKTDHIGGP